MRLLSDSLFNLADDVLNFSCVLFSNAISFQVGVVRELASLLLDCAFDFVKVTGCLIFCARFHRDSLLCSVVVVDSLKSMGGYSHLDCLRPGKTLFGEVSLPDSEPCIDQYRTIGSLIAGHNCSQGSAQQGSQTQAGLGERLSETHQPMANRHARSEQRRALQSVHRSQFDDQHYRPVLIRQRPESRPTVSTWATLMPNVSARRRYVRFGCGRNNHCDCADCVAHPARVIRLGVQSCWPGVDPIAVPGSSVGVHAPGTRVSSASGMSYGRCRF